MSVDAGTRGGHPPEIHLELELRTGVPERLLWVLGTELTSSGRAVHALGTEPSFQAPLVVFKF